MTTSSTTREDILGGIVTQGTDQAFATMGRLLGEFALVHEPPRRGQLPQLCDPLFAASPSTMALTLDLHGATFGRLAIVLSAEASKSIAERLLEGFSEFDDSVAQSALLELANIGACAFCDAVAPSFGAAWLPGVPAMHRDAWKSLSVELVRGILNPVVLGSRATAAQSPVAFLLLLDPAGAARLAPRR